MAVAGWIIVGVVYVVGTAAALIARRFLFTSSTWLALSQMSTPPVPIPLFRIPRMSVPEHLFIWTHILTLGLGLYLKAAYTDSDQPDATAAAELADKADLVHITVGDAAWRVGLELGPLSLFSLGLLFVPIIRSRWFTVVIGISYERRIIIHRIAARVFLLLSTLHGVMILVLNHGHGLDKYGKNLTGLLSTLFFLFVGLTSVEQVRRKWFDLFFLSHYTFVLAMLFGVLHAGGVVLAILAGLPRAITAAFRVYLVFRNKTQLVAARTLPGEVVELVLRAPSDPRCTVDRPIEPGQYVFMGDPLVGWELHPITIANYVVPDADGNRNLRFLIKAAALHEQPRQWSSQLYNAVAAVESAGGDMSEISDAVESLTPQQVARLQSRDSDASIHMHMEGYYGLLAIDPNNYTSLVLVSGGIGVTPNAAILEALLHPESEISVVGSDTVIHFVWALRGATLFTAWYPELLAAAAASPNVVLHLYDTTTEKGSVSVGSGHSSAKAKIHPVTGSQSDGSGSLTYSYSEEEEEEEEASSATTASSSTAASSSTGSSSSAAAAAPIKGGRPNMDDILGGIPTRAGVFVCGPQPLVEVTIKASRRHGHHVHTELFDF